MAAHEQQDERLILNRADLRIARRHQHGVGHQQRRDGLLTAVPRQLAAQVIRQAPDGHPNVQVVAWTEPVPPLAPGDAVVEAFGCDPPADFVARMGARRDPPAWINLEYLSAEGYV